MLSYGTSIKFFSLMSLIDLDLHGFHLSVKSGFFLQLCIEYLALVTLAWVFIRGINACAISSNMSILYFRGICQRNNIYLQILTKPVDVGSLTALNY